MLKDTIKYQFKNNFISGVYCNISPDGTKVFRIVKVENKNGNLNFELSGEVTEKISEIKSLIRNTPVYLVMDGKGILLKNFVAEPDKPLLKQIIPTAKEDEFIMDTFSGENAIIHAAIARKDLVDEVLEQLKQEGLNIVCLSLGPYRAANLMKYFDELPGEMCFENNLIQYNKQKQVISLFERSNINKNQNYIIDSKEVNSVYLPALSVALEYFLEENTECDHPEIKEQKREFQFKIVFQKAGMAALLLVLVVLLANMFFYMHYHDKKQLIEYHLAGNKNILNALDTLKQELEWKEKFLKESGILRNTRMAFYADRIAATVPDEITLEKLEVNPLVGKIRSNKEISLRLNIILLGGFTKTSLDLNDWVHKLKKLNWIENVAIVNYTQLNEMSAGAFSIELGIKQINN